MHLAPIGATPLSKALKGKTNCALAALIAASLVWSARRLRLLTDTSPCLWVAETVLCWQSDPLYFNRNFAKQFIRPMPEVREAMAVALCRETSALFMVSPGSALTDPRIQIAENVIALTRHVLGPFEAPLRTSLKAVIRRLDALAPNPYQDFRGAFDFDSDAEYLEYKRRNMGPPLPIEVADPSREDHARRSRTALRRLHRLGRLGRQPVPALARGAAAGGLRGQALPPQLAMLTPPLCVEIGQLPLPRPTSFEWDEWNFQGYFLYAVRDSSPTLGS